MEITVAEALLGAAAMYERLHPESSWAALSTQDQLTWADAFCTAAAEAGLRTFTVPEPLNG